MTVNELIEKLQKLKEEHGDIECVSTNCYVGDDSEVFQIFDPGYDKKFNVIIVCVID